MELLKKHSSDLSRVDLSLIRQDIEKAEVHLKKGKDKTTILEHLARICNDKTLINPEWALLAGRVLMETILGIVTHTFVEGTRSMKPILNDGYYNFVMNNQDFLEGILRPERDFMFNIFAIATLKKSYLAHLKVDDKSYLMETPQYMYLRVATYLHFPDKIAIYRMYESISKGLYSQATPTLFNAGMKKPQLSSCFLGSVSDDMEGLSKSWHDQAIISMNSGGLGYDYSNIRHSEIGQHGFSRGLTPWLKISNEILKTVDQAGKRKGSGTMYNRVWHVDIYEFVELRDEGPEDMRAKDLFLALMVDDLFMKRVENDQDWSLFCPNKAKGLADTWGEKFEALYHKYEQDGIASHVVKARDLWNIILTMQIKKGMPFLLGMDAINDKSNQKHAGLIRCSNLCTEIALNTGPDEIASCILGSIAVNNCVKMVEGNPVFDFDLLEVLVAEEVRNKNNVIDRNYYPRDIPEIRYSNMRHRPIGIGVQGYADAVAMLDMSWVTPNPYYDEANPHSKKYILNLKLKELNVQIFETMYYAAVKESVALAKIYGHYETFPGSPASNGQFQFDMWKGGRISRYKTEQWEELRQDMMRHGLRNSTLLSIMPTASSAHILGNQEACEPFTELIFARSVLSGQFMLVNKHVVADLEAINLWNDETIKLIINNRSLQNVTLRVADEKRAKRLEFLKLKYLTVFELPQAIILELGADRGKYICQTESRNCHMSKPTRSKLNAYHFQAWKLGLKTWMYYLRQKAGSDPINFSDDYKIIPVSQTLEDGTLVTRKKAKIECTDDICMSCNV
ncbi:MAG TPA: ribonucleoside-diphosphate reductase subunit alpha [Saprospiraceae bacterium]|nr:ribonucleoside-diphosphate reductase subunit alpha [Saprospiraceae bacterium]